MEYQGATGTPYLASLHVWVQDGEGRPLEGLYAEDFEVLEDSEPREIAVFVEQKGEAATPPSIVLAVDASRPRGMSAYPARKMLWEFLAQIPRRAEIALLSFSETMRLLSGFETDRQAVRDAVGRIEDHRGHGGPVLYDALLESLSLLDATGNRRQILILVGGVDDRGSGTSYLTLEHRMSAAACVFFATGLVSRDLGSGSSEPQAEGAAPESPVPAMGMNARWKLSRLTAMTGGLASFSGRLRELGRSLGGVAMQLRHHYLLEYYTSPTPEPGHFHSVEVRLTRMRTARRIRVRSRLGYWR
jgi:VWFA-related protein